MCEAQNHTVLPIVLHFLLSFACVSCATLASRSSAGTPLSNDLGHTARRSAPALAGVQSATPARPTHPRLQVRMDAVTQAFAERGGIVVDPVVSGFLAPQNALLARIHLERDACVGFVAVGIQAGGNVDIAVHDSGGVKLVEDLRPDSHPYVRLCVRGDADLTVVATARDFAGPIAIMTVANPPVVAPDLAAAIGVRAEGGLTGPRTPRAPIAMDPAPQSAEDALVRLGTRLALLGYSPVGERTVGELQPHAPVQHSQELARAGCFGLQVASDADNEGLRVELLDAAGTVVGATRTPESQPFVRGCLSTGGRYIARLSSDSGGHYAVQWFQHPDDPSLSSEYTGESRAGILELSSLAAQRNFVHRRFIERVSTLGVAYIRELPVTAGACFFIGAVGSSTPIELSLLDDQNRVLASDTSGSQLPRLWACSSRSQVARIVARPGTNRGDFVIFSLESSS